MTKTTYTVKYRNPGAWWFKTIKNVWRDEICYGYYETIKQENGTFREIGHDPIFRAFTTEDDRIYYCSLDAEVIFEPDRQSVIQKQQSKSAGTEVVRN